jgi:hypothetical protein
MLRNVRVYLCALVVLAATTAFAKGASGTITLYEAATVAGTQLAPGEYKVSLQDNGELTVSQGKRVVAKAQASVEAQPRAKATTEIITQSGKIVRIQFENSKQAIVLSDTVAKLNP